MSDCTNRGRLIRRLHQIANLQKDLEKFLQGLSSFAVPVAGYYENETVPVIKNAPVQVKVPKQKEKREKGRVMKKKAAADEKSTPTQVTQSAAVSDTSSESVSPKPGTSKISLTVFQSSVSIQNYYRELEINVLDLIECKLSLSDQNSILEDDDCLSCEDLIFLLEDFSDKLKHGLPSSFKRSTGFLKVNSLKGLRFQRLDTLDETSLLIRVSKLIGPLFRHLESCKNFFKTVVEENDGVIDGSAMWSNLAQTISHCFCLIVSCLTLMLSWRGHGQTCNKEATKEMFRNIASALSLDENATVAVCVVTNSAIEHFLGYVDYITTLSSANDFLGLLSAFLEFGGSTENKEKISEIALSCLKREWNSVEGTPLKGSKINTNIKSLLCIASSNSSDERLNFIEKLIQNAFSEAVVNDNFCSDTYKTITKTTAGAWYQTLFLELVNASRKIGKIENSEKSLSGRDPAKKAAEKAETSLDLWIQAGRLFNFMMSVLKKTEMRSIVVTALQQGNNFVRCFTANCVVSLLDHSFAKSFENARRLLTSMQSGTRLLQTLCTHSKIIKKDGTLTKYVPPLKKTLEEFVYRVKAMMALNNCETALSIAILKSKDLQGKTLLSQKSFEENSESVETTVIEDSDVSDHSENDGDDKSNPVEDEGEENEDLEDDEDRISEMSESY